MNAVIPRFLNLSGSVGGPDGPRVCAGKLANLASLSGDRGSAAVRGEDQRSDASGAPKGAGGHDHVSQSSGEKHCSPGTDQTEAELARWYLAFLYITQHPLLVAFGPYRTLRSKHIIFNPASINGEQNQSLQNLL